jgi:hypothetical protein
MKAACLGLLLLVAPAAFVAGRSVPSIRVQDGRLLGSSEGPHTILRYRASDGARPQIVVGGQADVPIGPLTGLELLGETTEGVVVLSASYASREGFPMKQCGAGGETVVRVLQLRPRLHQTFSELVDSCWASIESRERRWQAGDHTLHLETTRYTAGEAMHQEAIYRVAPNGTTALLSTRQLD